MHGLRLEDLSLSQLGRIARQLRLDHSSELGRELAPTVKAQGYNTTELVLFELLDHLRIANWQRTKDGQKGTRPPKRVSPMAEDKTRRHGRATRPQADIRAVLARMAPQR
jgi:Family of unknown function (DUF5361)